MTRLFEDFADIALAGESLTRSQCAQVLTTPDDELLLLLHAAYTVRRRFFGEKVQVQMLSNAKSGICPEDCHYCSQSRVSTAPVAKYPLVAPDVLREQARQAKKANVNRLCMALSGRGPTDDELDTLCEALTAMKKETGLALCGSLGFLNDGQAERLKAAGLDRVNHNLNTSERYHSRICTTHSWSDRVATIRRCQKAGLEICSGGIIGQGETRDDVVDLFMALREIAPQAIPVNFLVPIEGTPFGEKVHSHALNPRYCLKVLCLARFLNPKAEIRAAGGREHHLRSLMPLALYPANSIFVEGYLTTGGQTLESAKDMLADLGFEADIEGDPACG